jgi:pimeloyl-ACP methyl ester carboxylesterase
VEWDADGRGHGAPVLLLSWFGLDRAAMATAFEPVFDDARDWRRVYVNLPGVGQTPAGLGHADDVVDALVDYIDRELGTLPFALAGCSYGGYLAAAIARRRPAQVAGLLLVCSGVKILPSERRLPPEPAEIPPPDWLREAPAELRPHLALALGNQTRQVAARVAALLASADTGDHEYLDRFRAQGYRLSDEDSSAVYTGPAAVLAGRRDRIAGYVDQFEMMSRYPRGTYVAVSEAGHYLPFEQPGIFKTMTLDWLHRCSTNPRLTSTG